MTLTLASATASAQPLRCGPVNRGRPNATGTGCDCQPGFHPQLLLGALRCRPDARPAARPACGPEEHRSAGHCCPPGEEWIPELDACHCVDTAVCGSPPPAPTPTPPPAPTPPPVRVPSPPPESVPSPPPVTTSRVPCGQGLEYVPGTNHCCWPGQRSEGGACRGAPTCPEQYLPHDESCVREGTSIPRNTGAEGALFAQQQASYRVRSWLPTFFGQASPAYVLGMELLSVISESALGVVGPQVTFRFQLPWFEVGVHIWASQPTISADEMRYPFTRILSPFAGIRLLSWPSLRYETIVFSAINLSGGFEAIWGSYGKNDPQPLGRGVNDRELFGYIANDMVLRTGSSEGLLFRIQYSQGLLSNRVFAPVIQLGLAVIFGIEASRAADARRPE